MNSFETSAQQLIATFTMNPDAVNATLPLSDQFNQFFQVLYSFALTTTTIPGANVYSMLRFQEQLVTQYPTNAFMQIASAIFAMIFFTAVISQLASQTFLQYAYGLVERFRYRKSIHTLSYYDPKKKKWLKQNIIPGRAWKYDETAQLWKLKLDNPEQPEKPERLEQRK